MILLWWYRSAYGEISLPFKDGIVEGLKFDGQPIQLLMDTGSSGTYVVYKDWYERTYGKGACKYFRGGCYSCPGECNPYVREKQVTTFGGGSEIITVLHKGKLTINKYRRLPLHFRLIIGFSPSPDIPNDRPMNILGLARPNIKHPQTVPSELFKYKITKKYAVSICSPSVDMYSFTGTLILGSWNGLCGIKSKPRTFLLNNTETAKYVSDLFYYALVSHGGEEMFTLQVQGRSVMYDTGTYGISCPKIMFDILVEKIKAISGPRVTVKTSNGIWFITNKGYEYFPDLTFAVGNRKDPFIISIPTEKYIVGCNGDWCELMLTPYHGSMVLLGRPFFLTNFTSLDLKLGAISIAEYGNGS